MDLRSALTRLLMAHTRREIEYRAEAVFERCVALDLAAKMRMTRPSRACRNFSCRLARLAARS
jgi:hypothetical protein